MARVLAVVLGLSIAVCGCGKGGGGGGAAAPNMDSPKATAQALVQAAKERSSAQAVALLPPDELIKKYFDCPGDELVKEIARARARADKDFGQAPKDVTIELGEFDKQGTEEKLLKVGEELDGCKAKAPVSVHKSKLELRMTKDGKTDFDGETWRFLKFGDDSKWYFLR